jgi:hypothetical protein
MVSVLFILCSMDELVPILQGMHAVGAGEAEQRARHAAPSAITLNSSPISLGEISTFTARARKSSALAVSPASTFDVCSKSPMPQLSRKLAWLVKPSTSSPASKPASATAVKSTCVVMSDRPGNQNGSSCTRCR